MKSEDYYRHFTNLLADLDENLSDRLTASLFLNGLNSNLRTALMKDSTIDLSSIDSIRQRCKYLSDINAIPKENSFTSRVSKLSSNGSSTRTNSSKKNKSFKICSHCKKPGHDKSQCFALHGRPESKSSQPSNKSNQTLKCSRCGRTNHTVADCIAKKHIDGHSLSLNAISGRSSSSSIQRNAPLGNINKSAVIQITTPMADFDALVDTGASYSCIDSSVTLSRKIKCDDNFYVTMANGTDVEISHYILVDIADIGCVKLYVVDNLNFDIILGFDLLSKLDFTINNSGIIINAAFFPFLKACQPPGLNNLHVDQQDDNIPAPWLQTILQKYSSTFEAPNPKSPALVPPVVIRTQEDAPPVKTKRWRHPPQVQHLLKEKLDELLSSGAIRRSRSSYATNVLLAKKERPCYDYRKLNAVTIKDSYSLPSIRDIFDYMNNCVIFSKMDCKSGYHQIPLHENSKHKTAFYFNNQLYEWNVMPFGLVNAPAEFQRALDKALGHYSQFCLVYIDDIIVFSKSLEEHIQHLNLVFAALQKYNFKLSLK
jgi:hypothetical protein